LAWWLVGWRPWALLLVLCAALYLPGIAALPPFDRDEARFVQATRQMLETGDFVRIRFQDEARNKKPAGIYWLQAAFVAALSGPESTWLVPYRLPSVLGATLAVLLTFGCGRRLLGPGGDAAALAGAALLGSSVALVAEAHLAKTDAALLAAVVAAQGALAAIYRRARDGGAAGPGPALLFWLAQGAGILLKGPIAPLVSGLTILALAAADREWRWLRGLRPLWGLPLALLVVLPWFLAIQQATGGGFLADAVGHDLLGKVGGARESHGAPPGYYLVLAMATFWPASLVLPAALAWGWRRRWEPAARFLLCWRGPSWLLFEAVPTKLPHYVLPLYPALALLAGGALAAGATLGRRWARRLAGGVWAVSGLVLAGGLVAAPVLMGTGVAPAGIFAAAAILVLGTLILRRPAGLAAAPLLALLAVLAFAPAFQLVLPGLDRLWLSREAATLVAAHPPPPGMPVISVGYNEPSLVFLLGTGTRFVPPEEAAAVLTTTPGAVALISDRDEAAFRRSLDERGAAPRPLGSVAGLNYSNGRRLTLTLYEAAG
jgi:4-amino-4-deoxy-L-arabinose transferase-like glycosyltransferase